jgi:2-keto-3-deoxy-L-rhamnonate aldolase RhmA
VAALNDDIVGIVQIESPSAAEQADEIAAIDGVDVLFVGPADLSHSLGVPGQFEHPTFLKAIDKVANATAKHGKSLGRLVPNVETGLEYNNRWGFDFICYSGDVWVLHNALQDAVNQLRAGCKSGKNAAKPAGKKKK